MLGWLLMLDTELVYMLQRLCHPSYIEGIAATCSQLGDPRYAYLAVFPFVFWWAGPHAGGHVLTTAALAEWLNVILKWVLRGDRPYWWVGVNGHLWSNSKQLIQVPITCETGPGVPSGHVMISMAVLMSFAQFITDPQAGGRGFRCSNWTKMGVDACIVMFVLVIGLTRVLISSHFIHQVILGAVIGVSLHIFTQKTHSLFYARLHWTTPPHTLTLLTVSLVLASLGFFTYYILKMLHLDPDFSVPLAMRYCADQSWVKVDTTPFYSLMRSSGTFLGMSFVAKLSRYFRLRTVIRAPTGRYHQRFAGLVLSYVFIIGLMYLPLRVADHIVGIYLFALVKAALVPVVTVLPLVLPCVY